MYFNFLKSFLCEDAWIDVFPHMITNMIFFFFSIQSIPFDFCGFISVIFFFRFFFAGPLVPGRRLPGAIRGGGGPVLRMGGSRIRRSAAGIPFTPNGAVCVWILKHMTEFPDFIHTPNPPLGSVDDGVWVICSLCVRSLT